jgi:dephospho-CoA kinase
MTIIGITGGIGSGKTTVCRVFEAMGVPVYYADDRAKAVMVEDGVLMQAVRDAFGDAAYRDGQLDRQFLAAQVFGSEEKLQMLNSLVHPAVARDFMGWAGERADEGHPFVVKEAAILFESGAYKAVNGTVLVTAPEEVRIGRVMQRDGVSEDEVRQRMVRQWPDERKAVLADHIIINDGKEPVLPQVVRLHGLWAAD